MRFWEQLFLFLLFEPHTHWMFNPLIFRGFHLGPNDSHTPLAVCLFSLVLLMLLAGDLNSSDFFNSLYKWSSNDESRYFFFIYLKQNLNFALKCKVMFSVMIWAIACLHDSPNIFGSETANMFIMVIKVFKENFFKDYRGSVKILHKQLQVNYRFYKQVCLWID